MYNQTDIYEAITVRTKLKVHNPFKTTTHQHIYNTANCPLEE
jgi:hypothetical protein